MANMLKNAAVLGVGAVAALYLINPTAGVLEFLPDVLPVVGNLDEATAVTVLIACARYYGIDVTNLFKRDTEPSALPDDTQKRKRLPPE
jgi:uncharacterized membrane protein YkvA (DUF1232 family)